MAAEGHKQPPWIAPIARAGIRLPQLKIFNSLTRRKDDFVPLDPAGGTVTWYACGPTVYEDAHLGHAKNYMSTDIIRRIMKDYFGFCVKFVMNITDIDDKIIVSSRQQNLLARFKQENATDDGSVSASLLTEVRAAFQHYIGKNLPSIPPDTTEETFHEKSDKLLAENAKPVTLATDMTPEQDQAASVADLLLKAHISTARSAVEALQAPGQLDHFLDQTTEILLPYLDFLHGAEIDSNDHKIYMELSRKFERRFTEDMEALNVLPPDQLTRVSEYVPQIVRFTEQIVTNGFAYSTADGSVYFDIDSFERAGHSYSRLEPWNKNNRALQADGEGSLSKGASMKRGEGDFALWKASKPGEPVWPSPWGNGRPGWHIECSAMASEVLGKTVDIHSGGVDLRFPHHDNELAQSEAYWSTPSCAVQWTNYFIHMGQLRIRGLKMSKSLKNYTTIRTVLAQSEWSARSLRICFLLMPWQDGIEVTDELMKTVVGWEGKLNNFFLKALDILKQRMPPPATGEETCESDRQLLNSLEQAKSNVDLALRDSFNTSAVMRIISDLVTESNSADSLLDSTILSLGRWITQLVNIFGLDPEGYVNEPDRIGWSGLDIPAAAKPYVYPVSQLRDGLRAMACTGSLDYSAIAQLVESITVSSPTPADESSIPFFRVFEQFQNDAKAVADRQMPAKELLALCDHLRDVQLWNLGIYLEDRLHSHPALVRPLDKLLIESRAEQETVRAARLQAKLEQEAKMVEMEREQCERAKVDPLSMFRHSEAYSKWDQQGIPTVDAEGNELSKSRRKKLVKEWEKQKKRHEEWLSMQQSKGSVASNL